MSCDNELANEWPRSGGKNASYITKNVRFLCRFSQNSNAKTGVVNFCSKHERAALNLRSIIQGLIKAVN